MVFYEIENWVKGRELMYGFEDLVCGLVCGQVKTVCVSKKKTTVKLLQILTLSNSFFLLEWPYVGTENAQICFPLYETFITQLYFILNNWARCIIIIFLKSDWSKPEL